ncbi:MAG: hypothetical protein ACJ754_12400 [Pyrinomonadaceae bacterium]
MEDELCKKMRDENWKWADKDPHALAILEGKIAEVGRTLGMITYSDLVKGVDFHLPNVRNGQAYRVPIHDWSGFDRGMVGEFLGYISMRSYCEHGFMASALVVNRLEYKPSDLFFEWMVRLNVLPETNEGTVLKYWIEQVNKAHNWYKAGRQ